MTSPTDDGPEARPEEPSAEEPFPCVIYISSAQGRSHADLLPSNRGRSSIVHSLIESLDLLDYDISNGDNDCNPDSQETPGREDRSINRARAIEPIPARRNDLTRFHDRDYVWTLFIIGKTLGKLIILSSSQIDALFKASNDAPSPENSFDLDACAEQPSPQKRVKRDVHDNNYNLEQVKEHETLTANAEDHGLEHVSSSGGFYIPSPDIRIP